MTPEEDNLFFTCSSCGWNEPYHYKGKKPPYGWNFRLKEDAYITKMSGDSLFGSGQVLIIGGDCYNCKKPVCKETSCSFFYDFTYCKNCVGKYNKNLPTEVKKKVGLLFGT